VSTSKKPRGRCSVVVVPERCDSDLSTCARSRRRIEASATSSSSVKTRFRNVSRRRLSAPRRASSESIQSRHCRRQMCSRVSSEGAPRTLPPRTGPALQKGNPVGSLVRTFESGSSTTTRRARPAIWRVPSGGAHQALTLVHAVLGSVGPALTIDRRVSQPSASTRMTCGITKGGECYHRPEMNDACPLVVHEEAARAISTGPACASPSRSRPQGRRAAASPGRQCAAVDCTWT